MATTTAERLWTLTEKLDELRHKAADDSAAWTEGDQAEFEMLSEEYTTLRSRQRVADSPVFASGDEIRKALSGSGGLARRELEEEHEIQRTNRRLSGDFGGTGPLFRNASTGREIRSLKHDERMTEADLDVGACMRGLLTQDFSGLTEREQRAVSGLTDAGGGYTLNPALSGQIIDLARSASVALRAGAVTIPMDTRELSLVRVTQDPSPSWRGENAAIPVSDVEVGRLTLRAKALAVVIPVSLEILEDAENADRVIRMAIQGAFAGAIDQAILMGAGSASEPLGITETSGVGEVTSVGTPTSYAHISDAVEKVLTANYQGQVADLGWVSHPRDLATLDKLQATDDQPMQPSVWASQLQRFSTTSIPTNLGGGSDESWSLVGDFSQCIIGLRYAGTRVEVFREGSVTGHNAVEDAKVLIRGLMRMDVGVARPGFFTKCTGIQA